MSTWEEPTRRCADALTELMTASLTNPRPARDAAGPDLDVAVTARAAVLAGIENVLRDLAPRTMHPARKGPTLAMAERDPLRAFGLVLRGRARPQLDRSPSQLLDSARPVGPVTELWATAGREALIADRIWTAAPRRLDGDHAWHVVGEITALAQAIAALDTDLAARADPHRPDVTALLDTTAGLRVTAQEARSIALGRRDRLIPSGAPPPGSPPISAPTILRPLAPADAAEVPKAVHRLASILRATDILSPRQVRGVALVTRDLCLLAAGNATDPAGHDLRTTLGDIVRPLHAMAIGDDGEAPILPETTGALDLQLRELRVYTREALAPPASLPNRAVATDLARRIPAAIGALIARTHAQLENHRWVIPERTNRTPLLYVTAKLDDPSAEPLLLRSLQDADSSARSLRERIAPPVLGESQLQVPPHVHQAQASAAAPPEVARWRPGHPAQPPIRRGPATQI